MDKAITNAFKALDKLNEDSTILSHGVLSCVSDYIDTGSYALNAIISGSLYGGIPVGRITGLTGPSGCGKTLIMLKIMANAQKRGMIPVIWDSEAAVDMATAKSLGCDPEKIKHCPVDTIESAKKQIAVFLSAVLADPDLHGKFIIGLDSLGNLASEKESSDAIDGHSAQDMGLRAKTIKSMYRIFTYSCAKAGIPFIFTNHIYENPNAMYDTLIKKQSGGLGPTYLASVLVQLSQTQQKANQDIYEGEVLPMARKINGINMRALTVKNRFIPPMLETELYLNFKTGLNKYSGLFEIAKSFGIIVGDKSYELQDGTKLGFRKSILDNEEAWKKIMPLLEEKIKSELRYSNEELEKIKREVEELDADKNSP